MHCVWAAFFEWVIVLQVVVIGVVGGTGGRWAQYRSIRWSKKISGDQVWALCGPSMYSNHSKLSNITTTGKFSANKIMATE